MIVKKFEIYWTYCINSSSEADVFGPILQQDLEKHVEKLVDAPDQFVTPSKDLSTMLLKTTKQLFDVGMPIYLILLFAS
jgi:hypothetical protein